MGRNLPLERNSSWNYGMGFDVEGIMKENPKKGDEVKENPREGQKPNKPEPNIQKKKNKNQNGYNRKQREYSK